MATAALCSSSVLEKCSAPEAGSVEQKYRYFCATYCSSGYSAATIASIDGLQIGPTGSPFRVYVLYAELTESSLSPSTIFCDPVAYLIVTSEPSVISALSRLWKTALTLAKSPFLASFSIIEARVTTSSIVIPSSCARSS